MGQFNLALLLFSCVLAVGGQPRQQASAYQRKIQRSRQIGMQSQIITRMFSDSSAYGFESRPPVRNSADNSAIIVITSIYISRITWNQNIAKVELYLRQQWEDSRLSYDVDSRESIHEILLPRDRHIWRPDTFFIGADEDSDNSGEQQRSRIVIEPSGYVRSSERRTVTINTEDVSSFPLSNLRSFTLKLSSFNYPFDDVVYLWANSPPHVLPVEVSEELLDEDHTKYAFEDASAGDCSGNYSVDSYSCISVTIAFANRSTSELITMFLPSILLVIVSWLQFWIHGSWSVPRTFSAAIPFFIFVAVILFLPSPSKTATIWLIFCVVITFFSLVEYFLVIYRSIHRRVQFFNDSLPKTVGKDIKTKLYDPDGSQYDNNHNRYVPDEHAGYSPYQRDNDLTTGEVTTNTVVDPASRYDIQNKNITHVKNRIDIISRIIFPIIFVMFMIVFLIFYSL